MLGVVDAFSIRIYASCCKYIDVWKFLGRGLL